MRLQYFLNMLKNILLASNPLSENGNYHERTVFVSILLTKAWIPAV